jgi:3-oxoacyl-[acyl-carrier protein] reductase
VNLGLEGKVALVTGGSRGIGRAIARALANEGCRVAITHWEDSRNAEDLVKSIEAADGRAVAFESDVGCFTAAEQTVAEVERRLDGLDILVSNAGVTADAVLWKMTESAWDRVLEVNLKGCFNYCRAAATIFKRQASGKIVSIASINGLRGKFGQVNYAASKGGIIAMTRAMGRELGRYGVNVNAVAPGWTETEMTRDLPSEFTEAAKRESAFGRPGQVEDVAHAVVFLASDAARHITGVCLAVDGGQTM